MKHTHPILTAPKSPQHAADMAAALIERHRATFGDARMEGDDPPADDPPADDPPADGPPQVNEHGYPDRTPVADMTVEQQVAYWKHHARKHEDRARGRDDYDEIKAERDRLRQAAMTPDERAIEEAKNQAAEAARAQERAAWAPRLVTAKLEGALTAKGLKDEQVAAIIAPLDHTKFLTDSGEVDAAKVSNYAAGFSGGTQWPDMGQGNRGDGPASSKADAGRAEAERRFGNKS